MPRGGVRKKLKVDPVPMEERPCHGAGALDHPHMFLRPVGSHRRQCDRCFESSIRIREMPAFHDERGQR